MLVMLSACGNDQTDNTILETDYPSATDGVESVTPSIDEPVDVPEIINTEVQNAYEDMISATEHLSITNDGYKFKDYPISKDSVSKIDGELVVNQGAMYEEIAGGLALYCDFGLSQSLDETFFQILTGSGNKPENWNELANDLYSFILLDGSEKEIISKLETLDCVSGTFDYDARSYAFEITDLEKAASDLCISHEMLGYVLAKLNEYTDDITFDGNSVTCSLEVKTFS
jgi:hypothetical protein